VGICKVSVVVCKVFVRCLLELLRCVGVCKVFVRFFWELLRRLSVFIK